MKKASVKRVYEIVHVEEVVTELGTKKVRVCAITDPEKYRLARLNNRMPVKIETQIKGNSYEVAQRCESISTAQEMLETVIESMKAAVVPKHDVTIYDI